MQIYSRFRLCGCKQSRANSSPPNSLLTGKNTGDFHDSLAQVPIIFPLTTTIHKDKTLAPIQMEQGVNRERSGNPIP